MKCPFCEATIAPGKRFCTECGKYLAPEARIEESEKPETAAAEPPVSAPAEEPADTIPEAEPAPVREPESTPEEESAPAEPAPAANAKEVADEAAPAADKPVAAEHLSVMPTDPNKPATADLMIPVEPDQKPEKNSQWAPVGTCGWLGIRLLMLIPIVNIVFLLIWSFGGTKKNVKQSWARATLVWVLLLLIAVLGFLLYCLIHPAFWQDLMKLF